MRILFYKRTGLAYNPDAWVAAFNKYTEHECRLVNQIPVDLNSFDFVHFNNTYVPFEGFEKRSIMHYHGHPKYENICGQIHLDFPGKVIVNPGHKAQGEYRDKQAIRWFPIDLELPWYKQPTPTDVIRVCYSPSRTASSSPYHYKSYFEVTKIIEKVVARNTNIYFTTIINNPPNMCVQTKAQHNVVIDEFNTGNFNMSGFEGLAMGAMVIGKISESNDRLIREELCGEEAIKTPYESMEIEALEEFLNKLAICNKLEHILETGARNRQWIEKYWNLHDMLKQMEGIYLSVLNG